MGGREHSFMATDLCADVNRLKVSKVTVLSLVLRCLTVNS